MIHPKIIIIGGGLAGLSAGLVLAKKGVRVRLIEKKDYPFHRVCGEYISNEVWPFLKSLDLDPEGWNVPQINQLEVSSVQGRILKQDLDLGGFGMSRYNLDKILSESFVEWGGELITQTKINQVDYIENEFYLKDSTGKTYQADYVIGAYGKRSNLDQVLNRSFFRNRSPFLGIKYHLNFDLPKNLIQLHNFQGGYAGISAIENQKYCFCYLSKTENLKKHKTIPEMESEVLKKNPYLKNIFENAEFLWDKPQVIQEISFEPKELVFDHILMCGDSAGLISPLCGNGMAIALHSGKILAECILEWSKKSENPENRIQLENDYKKRWKNLFHKRLWVGRQIQKLFGNNTLTDFTLGAFNSSPKLTRLLINSTHGNPF